MIAVKNTPTDPSPILAFSQAASARGWVFEPSSIHLECIQGWEVNHDALTVGDSVYPTLRTPCGSVKLALDSIPLHIHNGRVWRGCPTDVRHDRIVLAAIVVDERFRRQGFATEAMKQFLAIADEHGFEVELEAQPIEAFKAKGQRSISRRKLVDWYKSLGFVVKEGNILRREKK